MNLIPDKALLHHIAILGKAGSGKTVTAKGAAEHLLDAGARVCAVDPTGVWWGLKSSRDGKKAAYPIVIFGGEHADFTIGRNHGAAIAEIIGTSDMSSIIDTQQMTVGERTQFFTDFAETLLRKNKGPLHLMIDEAHVFAPQGRVNDPQSGKMLHAANNLVSLGRARGLRIVMISQRPAKLHKDSLTQVETLIAMRLIAPQDVGAVKDWIGEWADPKEGKEILQSLPSLKTGTGWIWSPEIGILKRAEFPMIRTYDSSRAPDGESAKVVLAQVDMDTIGAKLETAAAEVLADDPRRLKAKIAELEKRSKQPASADPNAIANAESKGALRGKTEGYAEAINAIMPLAEKLREISAAASEIARGIDAWSRKAPMPPTKRENVAQDRPTTKKAHQSTEKMASGERKILTALAQYPSGRTKRQVGMLAGYAINGGGFNNYLSALRSKGWMDGRGDDLRITEAGISALGSFDPLPTGDDLRHYWFGQLEKAPRAILESLTKVYPNCMTKEDVAEDCGYEAGGGGFNNALSRLRTLELIEGRGELKASDDLFPEAV
jgi:hypothetical protein